MENKFTWSNMKVGKDNIKVRLDRALCTSEWRFRFDKATIHHEAIIGSDHAPLRLQLFDNNMRKLAPFRIDERWLDD
ncbi:hypothetical protein LINPERHAP2_LOCUS1107 [Linum perenne]